MITDGNGRITEFEEKPEHPRSNLASMGIYIFSWKALKESLTALKDQPGCDFGKHIFHIAVITACGCLLMNLTDIGKMWGRWVPTGKPIWS